MKMSQMNKIVWKTGLSLSVRSQSFEEDRGIAVRGSRRNWLAFGCSRARGFLRVEAIGARRPTSETRLLAGFVGQRCRLRAMHAECFRRSADL
jgi:hypothetical protein